MSPKFQLWMDAIDDDLLEEAIAPVKKRTYLPWISIAVAACLVLTLAWPLLPGRDPAVTFSMLSDMGYPMTLPEEAEQIRYALVTLHDRKGAQASFVLQDTEYVYQEVKTPDPRPLSPEGNHRVLTWNVGSLDLQLLSSDSGTSVSWYAREDQTQRYLTAKADSRQVLTTANQILHMTGLDVAVAPENGENISCNVFQHLGLTVAETAFTVHGITWCYRMAATSLVEEDFADLSGTDDPAGGLTPCKVRWCDAKVGIHPDGSGKLLWFDVVPGILYCLTMDSGASEEALLDMAGRLFQPAQEYG